jgi:hypothetical protein
MGDQKYKNSIEKNFLGYISTYGFDHQKNPKFSSEKIPQSVDIRHISNFFSALNRYVIQTFKRCIVIFMLKKLQKKKKFLQKKVNHGGKIRILFFPENPENHFFIFLCVILHMPLIHYRVQPLNFNVPLFFFIAYDYCDMYM